MKSRRATEEIHDLYNSVGEIPIEKMFLFSFIAMKRDTTVLTKDLKNLHRGIFSIMNTGALLFNPLP
jgi:hypothetical protein